MLLIFEKNLWKILTICLSLLNVRSLFDWDFNKNLQYLYPGSLDWRRPPNIISAVKREMNSNESWVFSVTGLI